MVSVDDRATGPHSSESRAADHERLVLEPRDVEFDWTNLPFHYVPNEPMATHVLNVLHMLLPAGEEFFVRVFKKTLPLIKDDQLRLDVQGFIGQEAMHSQAHSGVVDHFDAQGRRDSVYQPDQVAVRKAAGGESSAEPATTVQLVARAGFVHRGN